MAAGGSPNDDFSEPPESEKWTPGQRFILKACGLWESPALEADWHLKTAAKQHGAWIDGKVDWQAQVGGTPQLFQEFWFNVLKRKGNPKPDWVTQQWDAYDRWLIENHETHRQGAAA